MSDERDRDVWETRSGARRNLTFPTRQYHVDDERRSFALLRPITDAAAQERIRNLVSIAVLIGESARSQYCEMRATVRLAVATRQSRTVSVSGSSNHCTRGQSDPLVATWEGRIDKITCVDSYRDFRERRLRNEHQKGWGWAQLTS